MTAREKNLVRRAEKFAMVDDVRRNSTRQGQWEASFLSLDCPDADGNLFDYGDCGRAAKRMFRELDAAYREHVRELRFRRALYQLRAYPELQKTLLAIRRFQRRQKIFSALQIGAETYKQRFFQLTKILRILT